MHATERCASVNCEPTRKEKAEGVRREQQAKMDVTSASSGWLTAAAPTGVGIARLPSTTTRVRASASQAAAAVHSTLGRMQNLAKPTWQRGQNKGDTAYCLQILSRNK